MDEQWSGTWLGDEDALLFPYDKFVVSKTYYPDQPCEYYVEQRQGGKFKDGARFDRLSGVNSWIEERI